jgi:hypothetical protein
MVFLYVLIHEAYSLHLSPTMTLSLAAYIAKISKLDPIEGVLITLFKRVPNGRRYDTL